MTALSEKLRISRICYLTAVNAANPSRVATVMMIAARITPHITERILFLMLAAESFAKKQKENDNLKASAFP